MNRNVEVMAETRDLTGKNRNDIGKFLFFLVIKKEMGKRSESVGANPKGLF